MQTFRIRAVLQVVPVFTCSRCGVKVPGDTQRLEYDVQSVHELSDIIDKMNPRSAQMPIGWSAYYHPRTVLYCCPNCDWKRPLSRPD